MKIALKLPLSALLLAAIAAGAAGPAPAGVCLPNSKTYTKCAGGKIVQCTRSRNIKCKTRETCTQTGQPCVLPALAR